MNLLYNKSLGSGEQNIKIFSDKKKNSDSMNLKEKEFGNRNQNMNMISKKKTWDFFL